MVALDQDHAVLQGAAGAAEPLHLGEAGQERGPALGQPVNHGHGLAVASAAIAEEPDDAVARNGRTTVDMANGPVQRLRPFPETVALLEKMGAKNNHRCVSC